MRDMRAGKAISVARNETLRADAFALLGYYFPIAAVIVLVLAMRCLQVY